MCFFAARGKDTTPSEKLWNEELSNGCELNNIGKKRQNAKAHSST